MHLPPVCQRIPQGLWLVLLCLSLAGWTATPALAQSAELTSLRTSREDGGLNLEFVARLNLPKTVEDALRHGVPLYFVAQADLKRSRWYWRDERIARISRSWRLAYQPLTGIWRVGLGGLNQTYATFPEALAAVSRSTGWRLVDLSQVEADNKYSVDFSFRLDTSQLPGPMQIGLGGQGDWLISVERSVRVE